MREAHPSFLFPETPPTELPRLGTRRVDYSGNAPVTSGQALLIYVSFVWRPPAAAPGLPLSVVDHQPFSAPPFQPLQPCAGNRRMLVRQRGLAEEWGDGVENGYKELSVKTLTNGGKVASELGSLRLGWHEGQ